MEQLEINDEQKEMLLEMCKTLFPEYKNIHSHGAFIYFNKGIAPLDSIHWFEFCMTHLTTILYNKLNNPNRGFTILYYRGMIIQESDHPINFLYEEFKKLKL